MIFSCSPPIIFCATIHAAGASKRTGLPMSFSCAQGCCARWKATSLGGLFLQTLADQPKVQTLARSTWFDAFQSSRRLSLIAEVAENSYYHFERELAPRDWLGAFEELKDFPVWAVDGHQTKHACHATKDAKGAHVPSGMIYGMCLHHGLMRPMARYYGDGQRPHEWSIFKQNWRSWLVQDSRARHAHLGGRSGLHR